MITIPQPQTGVKGLRLDVMHSSFRDSLSLTETLDHVTLVGTVDHRGLTARSTPAKDVTLLPRDYHSPFTPKDDAPAVALVIRTLFGGAPAPHLYLSPVVWDAEREVYTLPTDSDGPWMASGAYAHGDSRWSDLLRGYGHWYGSPVGLFDRHESWSLYAALSSD